MQVDLGQEITNRKEKILLLKEEIKALEAAKSVLEGSSDQDSAADRSKTVEDE